MEDERRRVPEEPPLSDYDRMALKKHKQKQKQKVGSTIPQLGTQSKQSVLPLKVPSKLEQNLLVFGQETCLTPAQLRGEDHIQVHEGAGRSPYEVGKPLLWPELLKHLPTRMYALHKWYMQTSATGTLFLEVRIEDQHYFRGKKQF